ncbi:MAG: multidrug efflux SMR transporter [Pseudomonas sp.]|uniref:DMT family transporter n=1 Tax=Pseudomonas sp. TaxID=306 RepID=UPI0032428A6A
MIRLSDARNQGVGLHTLPHEKPVCYRPGAVRTIVRSTEAPHMNHWVYLISAIVSEVIATSALKASTGFSKPLPSVVVLVGYLVSFYFLSLTLKTIPVGIAYAIWSGVGVVLISIVAWLLYGQKLDLPALIGMGLIISGVMVINLFSSTAGH